MKRMATMASIAAATLLSSSAMAADFTVEELHKSSLTATATFKSDYGVALHDEIFGIQVTKGRESGRVKLFYRQNGSAQSIDYFCHYHGPDELDCHEH